MTPVEMIGMIAAVAMPFWNIPLIIKIWKRKSSEDISLVWVMGVWVCILLMFPSALTSQDLVFKSFGIVNTLLFTCVVIAVFKFRNR
ncbi:MAG: hypothetical protein HYT97_02295 [Elusimicrobia bacterium]|nr:hypothetical protein [Elusimicrobiota bacterium]